MFFCEQYQESKCFEMRLYGEMWGVAGGHGETQCHSVRDCCWRLASQKWPVSCDGVDLSEGELAFQVSVHTRTSLLTYRTLVGVTRVGASAVLAACHSVGYSVLCAGTGPVTV